MNETVTQVRDTTGNPAPLGLLGFGMTTVLLNLHNAGFFELNSMILAMGICYGGAAQIVAGIMEWKKGNTFATTAFLSYGFFWWSLVVLVLLPKTGVATASNATAMGAYLALWGLFTFMMFIGTMRLNRALQVVFGSLTLLFCSARDRRIGRRQCRLQTRHGLRRNLLRPLRLLRRRCPGHQRSLRQNRPAPRSPEQIEAGILWRASDEPRPTPRQSEAFLRPRYQSIAPPIGSPINVLGSCRARALIESPRRFTIRIPIASCRPHDFWNASPERRRRTPSRRAA